MPAPWLTVYVLPSLVVKADKLAILSNPGINCTTSVRPCLESVNMIGSKDSRLVFGADLSIQVARGGRHAIVKGHAQGLENRLKHHVPR